MHVSMNTRGPSTVKAILIASVLGVAALLTGIYFGTLNSRDQGNQDKTRAALIAATLYPVDFRPLADFELSDQRGQIFTTGQLAGSWSLVFFGYTYCPDVCPLTLTTFKQIKAELIKRLPAASAANVNFILVSVDPERDTPDRLKEYVGFFDPKFIGLTDISERQTQLTSLTRSLGAFYAKQDTETGKTYLVDHSAGIFLINPQARIHALFSAPHRAVDIAQDILTIIANYRA